MTKNSPPPPPEYSVPPTAVATNEIELNILQDKIDSLYEVMRQTNVRSRGLKPGLHEEWCQRLDGIARRLRKLREE